HQFVAENGLQPLIIAALKAADIARPSTLENVSQVIRTLFADAPIPKSLMDAIEGAYTTLSETNPVVAVRSSATAEDLPDLSFAGQQDTYLNIEGQQNVLIAIRKCWASLWTARAIGYRIRNKIDQEIVYLAVVVQILVAADAAGVLFTSNPINRHLNEAMITAAWGLGEAVVGGLVTPDTITIDKTSGKVIAYETADKEVMTVRIHGGTAEKPVPADLRSQPVLDSDAITDLIRLGNTIETLYGQPMDIEWALANGKMAIVQARPITTLGQPGVPAPTEWVLPDPKGHYMRTSIVDLMPDPLTPLFETLGLSSFTNEIKNLIGRLTSTHYVLSSYSTVTINGYAYMTVKLSARDWVFLLMRFLPKMPSMLRTGKTYWKDVACVKYTETTAHWEQQMFSMLSAGELLTGVREITGAAMTHLTSVMMFLGACGGSEGLVTSAYNKMVKREGDPLASVLLMGFESAPVRGEMALYDLAQWCRTQPDLAEYMVNTESQKIADMLKNEVTPHGIRATIWQEWQDHFKRFLREFGYSIYNLDFGESIPSDNPALFLENCKLYIRGDGQSPYKRVQTSVERREALVTESLARLKGLKLKIFRMVLQWAQDLAPLREDGIANMGYGYPVLRQMLFKIGRQLVDHGAMKMPEDIFWLREVELEKMAEALDNDLPIESCTEIVEERKSTCRARKSVTPPPQLPAKEKYMGFNTNLFLAHGEQVGDTLRGVAASPGQVTATARVLHGPEDFDQMQQGDVLVASITTPAWTPLFVMASAVVTDTGGPLSHGSIVAREYGIPAVLGTGVATRTITSGQTITVDGTKGEVILLTRFKL
ncbi:MAG: hypothetical protein E4H27_06920, partial [Anaerolineales bacterium]